MNSIKLTKKELRAQLRPLLRNMTVDDRRIQSEIITQKILKHPCYGSAKRIAIYLSLDHEVDTNAILRDIFERKKLCFIPRYDSKSRFMQMLRLKSLDEVEKLPLTEWNIRQPGQEAQNDDDALNSGGLDLIITPGLAFTKSGQRLGSGKGYYDNFFQRLSQQGSSFHSIGIAFRQQILDTIPIESHDITVNQVITCDD